MVTGVTLSVSSSLQSIDFHVRYNYNMIPLGFIACTVILQVCSVILFIVPECHLWLLKYFRSVTPRSRRRVVPPEPEAALPQTDEPSLDAGSAPPPLNIDDSIPTTDCAFLPQTDEPNPGAESGPLLLDDAIPVTESGSHV